MRKLNDASPVVLDLIKDLGIKVFAYSQVPIEDSCFHYAMRDVCGYYNQMTDYIAFNEIVSAEYACLNELLLHEIAHWTGHISRLARKALINSQRNILCTEKQIFEEEAIAQYGMYKLAIWLGLDKIEYRYKRDRYLVNWISLYDQEKVEKESERILEYTRGLLQVKAA